MLKILHTLSEKFINKNIYIYGITRNSINVFTDLAYRGINICGFVEVNDRYVGERFMNRLIVGKDSLSKADAIVIIWDGVPRKEAEKELLGVEILYKDEVLDIDYKLKYKKVILYGIGERGEELYGLLAERGIKVSAVCVSRKQQDTWHGLKVYDVDELRDNQDISIIIAVKLQKYKNVMLERIKEYKVEKYVDEFLTEFWARESDLFQIINAANTNGKEIYLYGNDHDAIGLIESILDRYGISVKGKIYKTEIPELKIQNIYELAYKNTDNITVIVAEPNQIESQWVCETLDEIGFSLGEHNYTAICSKTAEHRNTMKNMVDCLVGHTDVGNGKVSGYAVYGTEEADIKILILGGSTSTDGHYRPVSWAYRFYQKLRKMGYKAAVYNGAACGYDIVQELLRLLRDGPYLRPDYVISLSGVNNIISKQRTENQFCIDTFIDWIKTLAPDREYFSGIRSNDETLYDFWHRNTKIMKMSAELFGAGFYSFLQPMRLSKKDLTLFDISMHELGDSFKNTMIFRERARIEKDKAYHNLISLFDDIEGAYIDYCHYSDKGNEMIADIIFDTVLMDMPSLFV